MDKEDSSTPIYFNKKSYIDNQKQNSKNEIQNGKSQTNSKNEKVYEFETNENNDLKFVSYKKIDNFINKDKIGANNLFEINKVEENVKRKNSNDYYTEEDWINFIKGKKEPSFDKILKEIRHGLNYNL